MLIDLNKKMKSRFFIQDIENKPFFNFVNKFWTIRLHKFGLKLKVRLILYQLFIELNISDYHPCPSRECWDYIDGRCNVISDCASIACSSSSMTISYNEKLKLLVDYLSPIPTNDGMQISCILGD